MAESEIEIRARATGFDTVAADAAKAEAALKSMGAAVRGVNSAGAGTKQLAEDMSRVTNGINIGSTIGKDIQRGISRELSNGGFWNNVFTGLNARFKTAGQNFAKSFSAGMQAATQNIRNMNGGNGPTHTQLLGGVAAGYGAFEFLRSVGEAASRREQARLNLAGLGKMTTKDQRATLERLADAESAKYGNLNGTGSLEFLTQMLQIQGTTEHLFANGGKGGALSPEGFAALDKIFGVMSWMKTYEGGKHAGDASSVVHEFESAIRGSELAGHLQPGEMADWLVNAVKSNIAYGVTPSQMLAAQRAGGSAFLLLDPEGMAIFSAMVQEQKQRAGVSLATNTSRLISGTGQTQLSNDALLKYGIIDENDVKAHPEHYKFGRDPNAPYGGILKVRDTSYYKNRDKIGADPYMWAATDLYDGIRKRVLKDKGIDIGDVTTPLSQRTQAQKTELIAAVGEAFGNRNAATQNTEAIIQIANLMKRLGIAAGIDLNQQARSDSFLHQTQAFSDQMEQLKTKLGEGILPTLNDYLKSFNSGISNFSDAVAKHPILGTLAKYGAELAMIFAGLSAARLAWIHIFSFPLQLLKSLAYLGAGAIGGIYSGGKALFGSLPKMLGLGGEAGAAGAGIVEGAEVAATTATLAKWLAPISKLGGLLSVVRRIFSLTSGVLTAYAIGDWAVNNTQVGGDFASAVTKGWSRWKADVLGSGASNAQKQLELEGVWKFNRDAWGLIGQQRRAGPAPSYLDTVLGDKAKWWDMAHNQGWMQHIQPVHAQPTWTPRVYGRGAAAFGGQSSGPVPVVVQSMPKAQPTQVTITVPMTVNVAKGSSLNSIGGAVGSAVQSKLDNALGDTHR